MEKIRNQDDAILFSDLDLRAPLSSMPKEKLNLRFLKPLKWLVVITLSGIFTGGVGTLIWYAYMQGYDEASAEHAPEIFADPSPFKVRPENPGGLQVPHQNRQVYEVMKGGVPADRVEHLLPMPEAPLIREISEDAVLPEKIEAPVFEEEAVDPPKKIVKAEKKVSKMAVEKPKKIKTKVPLPTKSAIIAKPVKVRLQFGLLPNAVAADRELTRLKYQYRDVLSSVYLSSIEIEKDHHKKIRIQSQQMNLEDAEKLQKKLKAKKITTIILR